MTNVHDAALAGSVGIPCGYLCYRIGTGGTLQRATASGSRRGGLLGIMDASGLAAANPDRLSRTIAAECRRSHHIGVLFDFPLSEDARDAFTALCERIRQQSLTLFVPSALAAHAPGCQVILPGSLSGGTFEEMLEDYKTRYRPQQICLELQRCRHSFSMPSDTPDGSRLTQQELQELLQQYRPKVFFSPELCTNYFTYRPADRSLRFVLFDDADTVSRRLRRAAQLDVHSCFLRCSDWGKDIKAIVAASTPIQK